MDQFRRQVSDLYRNSTTQPRTLYSRKRLDPHRLPRYEYRPTQNDEIRFIILLKGKEHDDIFIEIEHANVTSGQGYAALSYVWGDLKKKPQPVFVDKKSVHWITYNLWAALSRIRQRDKDLVLWTDAICIDQTCDNEKSQQIQNMPLIYPGAERVLCWLGEDDGTVSEAFDILTLWAKAYHNPALLLELVANVREQLADGAAGQSKALAALFARPYWRRAWCLQEVCAEPSKPPTLLCGRHELSWDVLHMGFFCLGSSLERHETWSLIGDNVEYILPMVSTSWRPSENMKLSDLIPRVARREASIPHDMIFSLLGLAERRRDVKYPPPDYDLSIEETCIIYTRAIIAQDERLCILNVVDSFREGDKVPSWCIKPGRWAKNRASDFDALDIQIYGPMYCATLGSTPCVEEPSGKNDKVLRIVGLELDKVYQVFDLCFFSTETLNLAGSWTEIIDLCNSFCSTHLISDVDITTGEPIVQAFLRTITCDEFWIHSRSERHWQSRDRFHAAYEAHMRTLGDDKSSIWMPKDQLFEHLATTFCFRMREPKDEAKDQTAKGTESASQAPPGFLERRACTELLMAIHDKVGKRRFIVTEKGHLGVGPPQCKPGDIACLFPGSTVPLILRQALSEQECRYVLVGDAYVHGVMYGEALEGKLASGKPTTMSGCEGWTVFSIE